MNILIDESLFQKIAQKFQKTLSKPAPEKPTPAPQQPAPWQPGATVKPVQRRVVPSLPTPEEPKARPHAASVLQDFQKVHDIEPEKPFYKGPMKNVLARGRDNPRTSPAVSALHLMRKSYQSESSLRPIIDFLRESIEADE